MQHGWMFALAGLLVLAPQPASTQEAPVGTVVFEATGKGRPPTEAEQKEAKTVSDSVRTACQSRPADKVCALVVYVGTDAIVGGQMGWRYREVTSVEGDQFTFRDPQRNETRTFGSAGMASYTEGEILERDGKDATMALHRHYRALLVVPHNATGLPKVFRIPNGDKVLEIKITAEMLLLPHG